MKSVDYYCSYFITYINIYIDTVNYILYLLYCIICIGNQASSAHQYTKRKCFCYHFSLNALKVLTSSQWCVFNNYSLDKHRHQIWEWFHIWKKIIQRHIVILKFQEQHFSFLAIFDFKSFGGVLWHLSFFLMSKN